MIVRNGAPDREEFKLMGAMHGMMGSIGQVPGHRQMMGQMSQMMQQMAEMHKQMGGVMETEKAERGETEWCGGKFIPGKGTNFAECK